MCIICVLVEQERMTRIEAVKAGMERIRTEALDDEELAHVREVIYDNAWVWEEFMKELEKEKVE